jgi:ECF sigma factor
MCVNYPDHSHFKPGVKLFACRGDRIDNQGGDDGPELRGTTAMASGGLITRWIGELKAGDPAAAQRLWEAYFAKLVALARARVRGAPLPCRRPGRRGAECLRQVLPRRRAWPVPPARRPRRLLAVPGRHHRAQSDRSGLLRGAGHPRRRPGACALGPGGQRGRRGARCRALTRTGRPGRRAVSAAPRPPRERDPPPRGDVEAEGIHQRRDRRQARSRPVHDRLQAPSDPADLVGGERP